ncbi:heterokaryon incompatibility protein-domain-containing protein [Xylariales sp. PMI_506]|nr:heterokaryon incompatibility protein-domain-containing protein [Xylariales sp. PMI_506]
MADDKDIRAKHTGRQPDDDSEEVVVNFGNEADTNMTLRLTARQRQLLEMSLEQLFHIPTEEMMALGEKIMRAQAAQQDGIDTALHFLDEHPTTAPDFIPELFQYKPLSKPTSLRLVQLYPETEDGMLHMEMREYDLDDHIPWYYCLSYCWGNPHAKGRTIDYYGEFAEEYDNSKLHAVSCNGRLMHIRQNLYDALKQLPDDPHLLTKGGAKFGGENVYFTDLHLHAVGGDVPLITTTIFRGSQVDARDNKGRTALILATINHHTAAVIALLEAGADPLIKDYSGMDCLDYATLHGWDDTEAEIEAFDPARIKRLERKHKHSGMGSRIWIDAICINQQDDTEKSAQVIVMDRIYKQASSVIAWMGRDDGTAAHAARAIEKLYPATTKGRLATSSIYPYREWTTQKAAYEAAGVVGVTMAEWSALAALYLRQNFRRMWCLQEMVLKGDTGIFIGDVFIAMHEFMEVTEQLHLLQEDFSPAPSQIFRESHPIEEEAYLIYELRLRPRIDQLPYDERKARFGDLRFWRGDGRETRLSLLEMILQTIKLQCFDPRDHIYALLGLCKDHPETPAIEVDYTKPYQSLYTEIMRLMLADSRLGNSLQLVAATPDSTIKGREGLPGWAMHFGQQMNAPFWDEHWSAAGKENTAFICARETDSFEAGWLAVQGKRVDIVCQKSGDRLGQLGSGFNPSWPSLVLALPQIYPQTGQPRTEVLWRTLCADTSRKDDTKTASAASPAAANYAAQFRHQLCAMLLAHAEQKSYLEYLTKKTRGGILLQAFSALTLGQEVTIKSPTEEETASILDTSLEGPWVKDAGVATALREMSLIHETDSPMGECAMPSMAQISSYLDNPLFRVWFPMNDGLESSVLELETIKLKLDAKANYMMPIPAEGDGFRSQYLKYNDGRRLFITEKEKYMGLGPASVEPGDEIWVVKGSRVPFLLRPIIVEEEGKELAVPGKYRYLGDLYVHGLMKGEVMHGDTDWQSIILT